MIRRAALFVLALASFGASARELPAWLAGDWRMESGGKLTEESWLAPRDGLMVGMTRTTGGKKPWFEFMRIEQRADTLVFIAQPAGAPPTEFVALDGDDDAIVFENTAHDFPQRVRYARGADGGIDASIEGVVDGKPRVERWRYVRD